MNLLPGIYRNARAERVLTRRQRSGFGVLPYSYAGPDRSGVYIWPASYAPPVPVTTVAPAQVIRSGWVAPNPAGAIAPTVTSPAVAVPAPSWLDAEMILGLPNKYLLGLAAVVGVVLFMRGRGK